MNQFQQRRGARGEASGAINTSDSYYAGELAASTNQEVTLPTNTNIVVFSANGDFYCRYDSSAAVIPTGSIDADSVELTPSVRDVSDSGITDLNIIAPATTKITLAFYS